MLESLNIPLKFTFNKCFYTIFYVIYTGYSDNKHVINSTLALVWRKCLRKDLKKLGKGHMKWITAG